MASSPPRFAALSTHQLLFQHPANATRGMRTTLHADPRMQGARSTRGARRERVSRRLTAAVYASEHAAGRLCTILARFLRQQIHQASKVRRTPPTPCAHACDRARVPGRNLACTDVTDVSVRAAGRARAARLSWSGVVVSVMRGSSHALMYMSMCTRACTRACACAWRPESFPRGFRFTLSASGWVA